MSDRLDRIDAFLAGSGHETWRRDPIPVDASTRRYWRLHGPAGDTVILMDAPPPSENDLRSFCKIARHLQDLGLAAPKILSASEPEGLLLLEDLGTTSFAAWLQHRPRDEPELYGAAVGPIVLYGTAKPPAGLTVLTPDLAGEMVGLYCDWAVRKGFSKETNLAQAMSDSYAQHANGKRVLSLRDFHAENLVWRPNEDRFGKVGLLDFQDAFLATATYDLVSLLRDPRRDISQETVQLCRRSFCDATGISDSDLDTEFACVAVQRNLRIAGIYNRLILRDAKPRYGAFLPRVLAYLEQDLAHPALADLKKAVYACGPVNR